MVKTQSLPAAMSLYSLPNKLTSVRLGLAFVLFLLIWCELWLTGLAVFCIAAFTDWLDGYLARAHGLTSALGRVYDPLVDKVLVCGTFIFLLDQPLAGLNAWMVTIIVAREFVVTGLRGFLEEQGVSFGADWFGKVKMVLQCAAIVWILVALRLYDDGATAPAIGVVRDILNWGTVAATFASGVNYVRQALVHLT